VRKIRYVRKKYFRLFHFFIPSHGMYVPRLGIYVPRHGILFRDVEQRNEAAFGCFTSMCTRFLAVLLPYFSFLHFCFDWKKVFNDCRQILANWCGLWHLPVVVNWWLVVRCFVRLLFLLLCPIYRKSTLDMWTMLKRCCFGWKLFVQLWFSLYLCTVLLQYVLRYKVS